MYRQGAVGALLDIYEQAISDLKKVIENIPDNALTIITDPKQLTKIVNLSKQFYLTLYIRVTVMQPTFII
jgi:hypothetical protein